MQYWVILKHKDKNNQNDPIWFYDSILDFVPEKSIRLMEVGFVSNELDLCKDCKSAAYHCHVMDTTHDLKLCPILFCDAVKPHWKIEDLI